MIKFYAKTLVTISSSIKIQSRIQVSLKRLLTKLRGLAQVSVPSGIIKLDKHGGLQFKSEFCSYVPG